MQHRGGPENVAGILHVGAHGLAPTGQRDHQLPARPRQFAGRQCEAQGQFAYAQAFVLVGELVGASRRPDAQWQRLADARPPVEKLDHAGAGLRTFGGADPHLVRRAQARVGARIVLFDACCAIGVEVHYGGRQPAQNFRNDRPARAQRSYENAFSRRRAAHVGTPCRRPIRARLHTPRLRAFIRP